VITYRLDGRVELFKKPISLLFDRRPKEIPEGYASPILGVRFLGDRILISGVLNAKIWLNVSQPRVELMELYRSYFALYYGKDGRTYLQCNGKWTRIEGPRTWEIGGNYIRHKDLTIYPSLTALMR